MKIRLAPLLWLTGIFLIVFGVFGDFDFTDYSEDRALVAGGIIIAAAILMSALDRFRPPTA